MTTDEQSTPDQTGTWEPGIFFLARSAYRTQFDFPEWADVSAIEEEMWNQTARAVISELGRQQAERGIVEMDRERAEHLDRLWRFAWFERECVKNHAFDLWGEALDEIRTELDALGEPPRLPKDAGILSTATEQKS